jgi:hypothetical protein
MNDFEARLKNLDLTLFQHVVSQSTDGDKRSLLGLQRVLREANPGKGYVYLEIGSYLGGSLQPYVIDPLCQKIISIDPRQQCSSDMRVLVRYDENTTENMLRGLGRVPGADVSKIVSLENGAVNIDPNSIQPLPDLCFIDGEHTDAAVLGDSLFCQSVLKSEGWIAYHDANIVYDGILAFINVLKKEGITYRAYNFEDSIFLMELGNCNLSQSPLMSGLRQSSANGYLWSLHENNCYRQFYNRRFCRFLRETKARTWNRLFKRKTPSVGE